MEAPHALDSATTSELLVRALGPADLNANVVVCGDLSQDRGSGAVPATIAHHMGACQALGLLGVERESDTTLLATRRLDGARREKIRIPVPAVLSVEGGVANLRRAPLANALAGGSSGPTVEVRRVHLTSVVDPPRTHPWRPRARTYPAPAGDSAFERIVDLTDSLSDSAPPRTVEAAPAEAAAMIVEQLTEWGYLGGESGPE
jgi:electron transfer flavoprotein beta subunit